MADLQVVEKIIENDLVLKYLLSCKEIVYIGIAKRKNQIDGEFTLRIAMSEKNDDLKAKLTSDAYLNSILPVEVCYKLLKPNRKITKDRDRSFSRLDPLQPGIAIQSVTPCGIKSKLGAISSIVFRNGEPYILSNCHIMTSPGETVYQPNSHNTTHDLNVVGIVEHTDELLDCAIAKLINRGYILNIFNLDIIPAVTLPVRLGDRVVKYGLISKCTNGVVSTIKAVVKKQNNRYFRQQFIIEPDGFDYPDDLEVSVAGDSGAPWVKMDGQNNISNVLLGIESGGDPSDIDYNLETEYAHASEMASIQKALQIQLSKP